MAEAIDVGSSGSIVVACSLLFASSVGYNWVLNKTQTGDCMARVVLDARPVGASHAWESDVCIPSENHEATFC